MELARIGVSVGVTKQMKSTKADEVHADTLLHAL
jgi:hypothetical protein